MIPALAKILQMISELVESNGLILINTKSENKVITYFSDEIFDKNNIQRFEEETKDFSSFNRESILSIPSIKTLIESNKILDVFISDLGSGNMLLLFFMSFITDSDRYKIKNNTPVFNYLKNYIDDLKQSPLNYGYRLQETIDNIPATIYASDKNASQYYFVSNSIKALFGVCADDIYKHRYILLRSIYPDDFPAFKKFIKRINNGDPSHVDYRFKDITGKIKYVRHTGHPIFEEGRLVRIVGMIRDITIERSLIQKLKKSEEKLDLLVKTSAGIIFSLDSSGHFISINPSGAVELGYNIEEILGKHFLEFIDENNQPEIVKAFQKILQTDSVVSFTAEFVDKFGKNIIYDVQAMSTKENGKITGMLGIGSDVTTKRRDEDKLKELNTKITEANRIISIERDRAKHQITVLEELNKLKNDFISNVSHELRTPLASIVGFAETISSDEDLPKEVVLEFNNIILTEGKRLAKLVNDILDFSKLETNKETLNLTTFDLIPLLKESVANFKQQASDKKVELVTELPEAEIIMNGDRDRITKAIGNLISNGVKFTPEDGRILVIARDFLKEVEIMISDTGIGIAKDDLPKLFQKFSKAQNSDSQMPGAGFGLAIVKQIVDLHKGLIQVNSEVNEGTTFVLRLPKNNK